MEVNIVSGRGYVPAAEAQNETDEIGLINLDASFSPVRNVKYYVENARVGQQTDYDRLITEVTTNGARLMLAIAVAGGRGLEARPYVLDNAHALIPAFAEREPRSTCSRSSRKSRTFDLDSWKSALPIAGMD